ncbi:MAG: hypothetical protein RLY31_2288 [Bacteroidota bacterium]
MHDLSKNAWPAKLLLFGEHTVNSGSNALAVPLTAYQARWQRPEGLSKNALTTLQQQLPEFAAYLSGLSGAGGLPLPLDTDGFSAAVAAGWVLASDIPAGYGAGSSGALVAAVYACWGTPSGNLDLLKRMLSTMEGFFHGTSSGTDPLICYLQEPLLLHRESGMQVVALPPPPQHIKLFLLDTGIQRKATPLIGWFLSRTEDPDFRRSCTNGLLPAVDGAIVAFLEGREEDLFYAFHEISTFQSVHLTRLVPEGLLSTWEEGLQGSLFRLKLCGAGGGGFLLGITQDWVGLRRRYPELRLFDVNLWEKGNGRPVSVESTAY